MIMIILYGEKNVYEDILRNSREVGVMKKFELGFCPLRIKIRNYHTAKF